MSPSRAPLLSVQHVTKTYGSTTALNNAALELNGGEIHGLLGHNGSGKSTLIKILAGVVAPDSGQLSVHGEDVPLPLSAAEADRRGLRFVHQNLGLVDSLTVAENLLLSKFALGHRPIKWPAVFTQARGILDTYELEVDPRAVMSTLSPLQRAQVAIARALSTLAADEADNRAAVLVLDEPTVYLPKREVGNLFKLLHRVAGHGHAILLVTHRLVELIEHTDRVSILRDAHVIATKETAQTTEDELVELAVGSSWRTAEVPTIQARVDETDPIHHTLIQDLRTKRLTGVDLTLTPGEIHGLTGLSESGYEQILYALFGAAEGVSGTLVQGHRHLGLSTLTPALAIKYGICLIPVNRLAQGVAGPATIAENTSLPILGRYFRRGRLRLSEEATATDGLIQKYGTVAGSRDARVDTLSGGNQQKVLIAKWLQQQPSLLLLHEPTQGVDIRARHDIWKSVRAAAVDSPVLVATSDYDELATLCTSVSIIADGRIRKTLSGSALTADLIAAECLKGSAPTGLDGRGGAVA